MVFFRNTAVAAILTCCTLERASANEFSLFGLMDYAKKINYEFLETFVISELRKLWDKEIGNFLLCTGQHAASGAENWGIYTEEDLRRFACDEEWKIRRLSQVGGRLAEIFQDATLSEDGKAFAIAAEIEEDASLVSLRYEEPPSFSAGYSLKYGVMRLHFSNMISARDVCPAGNIQTTVTEDTISTDFVVYSERIYIQPSYRLTKYVDGEPEILAFVGERMVAVREGVFGINWISGQVNAFKLKWQDAISGMYKFLSAEAKLRSFPGGDLVFYDFDVDLRPEGTMLTYKLEVFHSGGHRCPPPRGWVQELVVDKDGDGDIDFIPESYYERYRASLFPPEIMPKPKAVYSRLGHASSLSDCFIGDVDGILPTIYTRVYDGPDPERWMIENCGPVFE